MCTAVDISRIRSLESDQRRLIEDLALAAQRYEFALRGSNVAVFTQDTDLRYSSVSKPLFGFDIDAMHGKTDAELLAAGPRRGDCCAQERGAATAASRATQSCASRPPPARAGTISISSRCATFRAVWSGVTGAAVDMTERKEGEAHLRLLMRELTHRSKNLLAVIQAMARQTAKHTGSIQTFLERFSARVQALARSHDILVQESWHGASLKELVRSQLAHLSRSRTRSGLDRRAGCSTEAGGGAESRARLA